MRRRTKIHLAVNLLLLLLAAAGLLIIFFPTLASSLPFTASFTANSGDSTLPMTSVSGASAQPTTAPSATTSPVPSSDPSPVPTTTQEAASPPSSPSNSYQEALWVAVGDIMMHSPELPGAYNKKTKSYNFDPFFQDVEPILKEGDWVLANLETPVAGSAFEYTGYPTFNAPVALLDALQNAGFNILTNANNHVLDKGEKGLLLTLAHMKEKGFIIKGSAATQKEADTNIIVEKNGIRMGLLAYTYGTNGIAIPKGKPYMVPLIDEQKMIGDIKKLKKAGADFVTVALHFGTEYQTKPNEEQKTLARKLIAEGADIIAGSHTHVIQPYEVLEATDDNGRERQGLIIYSMGNFISNQRGDTKDYGVIYQVLIRKNNGDGSIQLADIEAIPTWVYRYKPDHNYRYRILPVEQTLAEQSSKLLTPDLYASLKKNLSLLRTRLESMS